MHKTTQAEFESKLKEATGNQFEVIGTYVTNNVKIALKCNICGNIIYKMPCKVTNKTPEGCYICNGKNRWKNTEYFKAEVAERFGDEFTILGDYEKARKPLLARHNVCNKEYLVAPGNLLGGKGCPICARQHSKYVREVETILDDMSVYYVREKRFQDCKDARPLPFDFYLPAYNICIEVDGEQHYVGWYHDATNLEYIAAHDQIKTAYCEDRNIRLIRLPYFELKNFKAILVKELHTNTEVTVAGKTASAP